MKATLLSEAAKLRRPSPYTSRQLSPDEATHYIPERPTKADLETAAKVGETADDVAERFGRSPEDVRTRCKVYKIPLLPRRSARRTIHPTMPTVAPPDVWTPPEGDAVVMLPGEAQEIATITGPCLPTTSSEFRQLMVRHPDWTGTQLAGYYGWANDEDKFWKRLRGKDIHAEQMRVADDLPSFQALRARERMRRATEAKQAKQAQEDTPMMVDTTKLGAAPVATPEALWSWSGALTPDELAALADKIKQTLQPQIMVEIIISVKML